jgi:hypothetical protein
MADAIIIFRGFNLNGIPCADFASSAFQVQASPPKNIKIFVKGKARGRLHRKSQKSIQ